MCTHLRNYMCLIAAEVAKLVTVVIGFPNHPTCTRQKCRNQNKENSGAPVGENRSSGSDSAGRAPSFRENAVKHTSTRVASRPGGMQGQVMS